ncbi:hypothetical protein GBZ26_11040 [Azospirillum formosense]|uniref:SH3 domain-containing protein n=1 Tax=Azospirillum formosense TaxID=861533 RepID=A0ABX2KT42_9PROT|nr:hypothetical protein [Azospirillum formosense]MBY3753858.1 hypothetical protein [Azospirillum formosense]NUB19746.1 hypothetical protein [Azospirillum formosense]
MRRVALPLLGLLALLGGPSAQADEAEPTFTPRPPPTAVLPRLTPLGAAGKAPPQGLAPLLPVPVLTAPAPSTAAEPVAAAAPAAEPPVPTDPGMGNLPLPARKPASPAATAVAENPPTNRFKGGYAKASKEDRGCALPGPIAEERSADTRRPAIAVGTRVRVRAAANLRVAPFCDAKVADVLERGETVTVMAVFGSWYEVGRNGRALGFVGASLLAGAKGR